jgi:hypothetical protein
MKLEDHNSSPLASPERKVALTLAACRVNSQYSASRSARRAPPLGSPHAINLVIVPTPAISSGKS